MTRRDAALGALGGASVSLAVWASDLASIRSLSFAGVSDTTAQERLFGLALPAVVGLELRLLLVHLAAGLLTGALAGVAFARTRARHAAAPLVVLGLHVLALLAMMGRYPQLYADRFWLAGGARAWLQRFASHVVGPAVFDLAFLALAAAVVAGALWRARASLGTRSLLALGAAAAVLSAWLGLGASRAAIRRAPDETRPNVLVVVIDSLRSDRVDSAEAMPHVSQLGAEGTLFRHAFTPVARTVPSWVSLLTGKEPRHTDVRTMFPDPGSLRNIGETFVTRLRDSGYRTFVVADFAGDMFPRMPAGFDRVDAPNLNAASLARATVLSAHTFSLPLLRLSPLRDVFGEWRNLASLSDPEWLVDRTLDELGRADGRPFAGAVFFGTPHFPYVAPHPDYLWRSDGYRGRYLYHAPPATGAETIGPRDVEQVRARYDGALRATDRALARLLEALRSAGALDHTLLVVTGDHGEELYEEPGIAGHGDTIGAERSQVVPILLRGPQIEKGRVVDEQVRLYDLGATLLARVEGQSGRRFGDGVDLLAAGELRPICVETGIWFFPGMPVGLVGRRLEYPGIADLLEVVPPKGEFALRPEWVRAVESYKSRGLVLGARLWSEQLTPAGREASARTLAGVRPAGEDADIAALFQARCVAGDASLGRFLDAIVWSGR